jgi:hypothetical protein
MVPNIDIIGVVLITVFVIGMYIWMAWPISRDETSHILTPERPPRRTDEVQDDLHLSEIKPPPRTVPDFSQS